MYQIFHEDFYNPSFQVFAISETSLQSAFEKKDIEELRAIAALYQMHQLHLDNQAQLISRLIKEMLDSKHLLALAYTSLEDQFEMLYKIAHAKHVRPERLDYSYLMRLITLQLVYIQQVDGVCYVQVFDEVKTLLEQLDLQTLPKLESSRACVRVMLAALHLYGVITHEHMLGLINYYTNIRIAETDYFELLDIAIIKGVGIDYTNDLVGLDQIARMSGLHNFYEQQALYQQAFYEPEIATFFAYEKEDFYEKPQQFLGLKPFLMESFPIDESYLLMFIDDLVLHYINEDQKHPLQDLFSIYRFEFQDDVQKEVFMQTLDYYLQFIKVRRLKGFSLYELNQQSLYAQTLS
ncbi:MAG: hypothetical protein ACRCZJ_04395 [Erysipelotrichaceae bacterium]